MGDVGTEALDDFDGGGGGGGGPPASVIIVVRWWKGTGLIVLPFAGDVLAVLIDFGADEGPACWAPGGGGGAVAVVLLHHPRHSSPHRRRRRRLQRS